MPTINLAVRGSSCDGSDKWVRQMLAKPVGSELVPKACSRGEGFFLSQFSQSLCHSMSGQWILQQTVREAYEVVMRSRQICWISSKTHPSSNWYFGDGPLPGKQLCAHSQNKSEHQNPARWAASWTESENEINFLSSLKGVCQLCSTTWS